MTKYKNPLDSQTVRGLLLALAPIVASMAGLRYDPAEFTGVLERVLSCANEVVALTGLAWALWGRWRTNSALSLSAPRSSKRRT